MAGFIYIMSNPSFVNGRVKIGKSERDPEEFRKFELETTGVPESFKVEYYAYTDHHDEVERTVHSKLRHLRPNKQREFFDVSVPEAIVLIRTSSAQIHHERVNYRSPEEIEKASREALARKASEERRVSEERTRRENEVHQEEQKRVEAKRQVDEELAKRQLVAKKAFAKLALFAILLPFSSSVSIILFGMLFGNAQLGILVWLGGWGLIYFLREQNKAYQGKEYDHKRSMLSRSNATKETDVYDSDFVTDLKELDRLLAGDTQRPAIWGKVGRNGSCPCGSGKKYKHCHGSFF